MKIGIVFGTNRNAATAEIASWMSEHFTSLGHLVVSSKPGSFDDFDCDLYVLGTAVYAFSTKKAGMATFIRANRERIGERPVAVFIVCGSEPLETYRTDPPLKRRLKAVFLNTNKYLASITTLLRTPPVATEVFKGYGEPADKVKIGFDSQRELVGSWCDSILAGTATSA